MSSVHQQRIASLDSLRGLAALSVVFSHYIWIFSNSPAETYRPFQEAVHWLGRTPFYMLWAGHEAVLVFFILSGFVLTLVVRRINLRSDYFRYVLKRFIRLWVPYMAAILLAVLCIAIFVQSEVPDFPRIKGWAQPFTWELIAEHASFVTTFPTNQLDMVIWSLVHEMRISIVFPFIMLAIMAFSVRTNLILFGAMGVFANWLWWHNANEAVVQDLALTAHYVFLFVIGALMAMNREVLAEWYSGLTFRKKLLLFCAAVLIYTYAGRFFAAIGIVLPLANDWPSIPAIVIIMMFVLFSLRVQTLMERPFILFLGRISYSLYLFHPIVLFSLVYLLYGRFNLFEILLIAFPLTLFVSWLAYRWVELPAIRLGRQLSQGGRKSKALAQAMSPDRAK